jgi:signal peptidase I
VSSSTSLRRGLGYVLLVIIIVAGFQLFLSSELGTSPVYVVVSPSMVPTLRIGDLVIAEPYPYSDIKVGDVIIYVPPSPDGGCSGLTIVHRVVAITSQGLITQGDDRITNPRPDEPYQWPPVTPECMKAKVVFAVPYLGLISMLIPPPLNYVLVALILLFVFLSELRPVKKEEVSASGGSGSQSPGPSQR